MKRYLRILAIAAICGTMVAPQIEARGNRPAQNPSAGVQSRSNGGGRAGGRAGNASKKDTGVRSNVGTPSRGGNSNGNVGRPGNNRPGSGNIDRPNYGGNHGGNHGGNLSRPGNNRPGSGNVDRPNNGGNNGGNHGGNVSRPGDNRPGSGNVDRPNHGGNHGGSHGGNVSRPGNDRPGSGNVDRPNHGGNHSGNVGRPGNGGTRPNNPGNHYGHNNPRPGNNPGHYGDYHHDHHGDYHHDHYRPHHPTPPPHRPHYGCAWSRPCPPRGWRLGPVYPTFSTVLGITFGSTFDVSLAYLFNNGYNVYSYGNDVVYLSNVNQLNLLWPDASLYYGTRGLSRGEFVYSTSYYDTMRYNDAYARLVAAYGAPVSTTYPTNGMQTCWFGNDGRFVTLQFMPTYGVDGILRYYTTLSFGL